MALIQILPMENSPILVLAKVPENVPMLEMVGNSPKLPNHDIRMEAYTLVWFGWPQLHNLTKWMLTAVLSFKVLPKSTTSGQHPLTTRHAKTS